MKRGDKTKIILVGVVLLISIFLFPLVFSEKASVSEKAYTCLQNKIDTQTCTALDLDEQIFSLLAVGKCKDELLVSSIDKTGYKCFGKHNSCNLKQTAQAIVALKIQGLDTSEYSSFFLSINSTENLNIDWFLQIDSQQPTNCTIVYPDETSYSIKINQDKTINSSAGNCLTLEDNNKYRLKIKSNCLDEKFEITCDENFFTNLLYKKSNEDVIHVSEKINSVTAGEFTTEKTNSFCLTQGSGCDYEGTLWATLAMQLLGKDISPYMPYLIINAEDNEEYIPESFLYYLTADSDFSIALMNEQDNHGYWKKNTNKFYDTAVALLSFNYQSGFETEKNKTINWLTEEQNSDGCWNSDIKNTAFLLASIWPENAGYIPTPPSNLNCINDSDCPGEEMCSGDGKCVDCINNSDCSGDGEQCTNGTCVNSNVLLTCEEAGYNCMTYTKCSKAEGEIDNEQICAGFNVCCNAQEENVICSDVAGGHVCSYDETCLGTRQDQISTSSGFCCKGTCEASDGEDTTISDCENNFGTCKSSCDNSTEEETTDECESHSDVCCIIKDSPNGFFEKLKEHLLFVIIFLILVLSLVAFVFRKKLFKKKENTQPEFTQRRPGMFPPRRPPAQLRKPIPQRRIIPKQKPVTQQIPKRVVQQKQKEDVFNQLREISK